MVSLLLFLLQKGQIGVILRVQSTSNIQLTSLTEQQQIGVIMANAQDKTNSKVLLNVYSLHLFTAWSQIAVFINFSFSVLAVFHLAYLGIMFDFNSRQQDSGYSLSHTLNKWASLSYSSHWIIFVCYIMYALI